MGLMTSAFLNTQQIMLTCLNVRLSFPAELSWEIEDLCVVLIEEAQISFNSI